MAGARVGSPRRRVQPRGADARAVVGAGAYRAPARRRPRRSDGDRRRRSRRARAACSRARSPKNPADRFETALEFAEALKDAFPAIVAGRSTRTRGRRAPQAPHRRTVGRGTAAAAATVRSRSASRIRRSTAPSRTCRRVAEPRSGERPRCVRRPNQSMHRDAPTLVAPAVADCGSPWSPRRDRRACRFAPAPIDAPHGQRRRHSSDRPRDWHRCRPSRCRSRRGGQRPPMPARRSATSRTPLSVLERSRVRPSGRWLLALVRRHRHRIRRRIRRRLREPASAGATAGACGGDSSRTRVHGRRGARARTGAAGHRRRDARLTDTPTAQTPTVGRRQLRIGSRRQHRCEPDRPRRGGRLLVRSTPAGARVVRRRPGLRPHAGDGSRSRRAARIASGSTRDGYATEERRVVITRSRPSQSLTVARRACRERAARRRAATARRRQPGGASRARSRVDSRPAGAKVFVDGQAGRHDAAVVAGDARPASTRFGSSTTATAAGRRRCASSSSEQNRVTASLER